MKILCYRIDDDFDGYRPEPFTYESVNDILDKLEDELLEQYSRNYRDLKVEFSDVNFNENSMSSEVIVFDRYRMISDSRFEFIPYSFYKDLSEYYDHLDECIDEFVISL